MPQPATNAPLPDPAAALHNAQAAYTQGNHSLAYYWASAAAHAAPQWEEPWLILAAVSQPQDSLYYINRALAINPESQRALNGKQWAEERLVKSGTALPVSSATAVPSKARKPASLLKKALIVLAVLAVAALAVVAVAGYAALNRQAVTPTPAAFIQPQPRPVKISFKTNPLMANLNEVGTSKAQQVTLPEPLMEPTPTTVPEVVVVVPPTSAPLPTLAPTSTPEPTTPVPTSEPVAEATEPVITPTTEAAIPVVQITPIEAPAALPPELAAPVVSAPAAGDGERWIDINLSTQQVFAYEGTVLVNSFIASTGTWETPTVTGQYRVYVKYTATDMRGPGYYLPDVPYTMYFYQGYGIHGTYWHNNFGTPMSHGCVNLPTGDAAWLFNWASVGTLVNIHY